MSALSELAGTHCIVLGVETQIGLSLIRELGAAGVRVIAFTHQPKALGLASRHVWRAEVVGPPRSEAWVQRLQELGESLPQCSLITISEANLLWLDTQRARLSALHLALPPREALALVLDKQRTLALAEELGLSIPRTEEPQSPEDIERLAQDFPFPAILKWKDPNAIAPRLSAAGIALEKVEYIEEGSALRRACARYAPVGAYPLVQQYCAGGGLGQFFFMHEGAAARRFQHLRVAEWPPEGGFSSVCDALPQEANAALQQQSIALLRAIGWQGVAMVEYRLDPQSGRAWLMEINGRFWGSYPLAFHAGAGFGVLTHAAALGRELPALAPARDDLRCRMMSTELKRLVRVLLRPSRIQDPRFVRRPLWELIRFTTDFLRPRVRYYLWSWADPKPWWRDLCQALKRS